MQVHAHVLRGMIALSFLLVVLPALHPSEIQRSLLYGNFPIAFERNQGQSDPAVEFLSRGRNYSLFLARDEAVLVLNCPSQPGQRAHGNTRAVACKKTEPQVVRLRWTDKQPSAVVGEKELPGKVNYLIGRNPSNWHSNISTFARVRYKHIYPGIDLVFYGSQGTLEFDFVVQPDADPRDIALTFDGVRNLQLDGAGDLILKVEGGEVRQHKPVVYQEINGRRSKLTGAYVIAGNKVGFRVSQYDSQRPLIIDPVLSYSTYIGGSRSDFGNSIAVDSSGRAYITGSTDSTDFPTKNARQPELRGRRNAFVTKLWSTGGGLIYSTYFGGSDFDLGTGIAVDSSGNAYVVGDTSSSDFPTTSGSFQTNNRGGQDVFIAKLSPSGSSLLYSTYLGGGGFDAARGMALDSSHRVYVGGFTSSFNFPLVNAAQNNYGGGTDAFAARLNATGTALTYSTYLGGLDREIGGGMAVDASSNAYVAGTTQSPNFPTTPSAFQRLLKGHADAFVTKLTSSGSLAYSTLLGGSSGDSGGAIAVDSSRRAYVTGQTDSTDFPTRSAFQRRSAGVDAYVTRLNASGTGLSYSTYLGGPVGSEAGQSIAVNSSNHAHVAGFTNSSNFPTKNALQRQFGGDLDVFVTKLWATGAGLHFSTYLGGSGREDQFPAVRLDGSGNMYISGTTFSDDFPTTRGAFRRRMAGKAQFTSDAFVVKIKP